MKKLLIVLLCLGLYGSAALCFAQDTLIQATPIQKGSPDNILAISAMDEELLNYGIRFIPPAGWQKVKLQEVPSAIYYSLPNKKATITISLPREAQAAAFQVSLMLFRMTKRLTSEKVIDFLNSKCYVFTFQEDKSGYEVIFKDYQFLKNGKIYTIDYAAAISFFDKYLSEFEKALDTFEVIE